MTTFPNSPRLLKGGIALLDPETSAVIRMIALQYNPETVTRSLSPQVFAGDGAERTEAVRLKGPPTETIKLEVEIDGKFVYKQRADGIIISTPTGTTAYALSAGGPILHPNVEAIAIVPISPHTLSNRPFTVNSASTIEVTLVQADEAQVSFDGQFQLAVEAGDKVLVQRATQTVTLLHPSDYCYFEMLRNKLNWG